MFATINVHRTLKPNEVSIRLSFREDGGKLCVTAHCSLEKLPPSNVDVSSDVATALGWLRTAFPTLVFGAELATAQAPAEQSAAPGEVSGEVLGNFVGGVLTGLANLAERAFGDDGAAARVEALAVEGRELLHGTTVLPDEQLRERLAAFVDACATAKLTDELFEMYAAAKGLLSELAPPVADVASNPAPTTPFAAGVALELEEVGRALLEGPELEPVELLARLEAFVSDCRTAPMTPGLLELYGRAQERRRALDASATPEQQPATDHDDIPFGVIVDRSTSTE